MGILLLLLLGLRFKLVLCWLCWYYIGCVGITLVVLVLRWLRWYFVSSVGISLVVLVFRWYFIGSVGISLNVDGK